MTDSLFNLKINNQSNHKMDLVFLLLFTFIIRLAIYILSGYKTMAGDEEFYWRSAHKIILGSYNSNGYMPGWPFLLSLVLRISDRLMAAHIYTIFFGSIASVFVYLLGIKVFDRQTAFVAGLLFALHPEHIMMSHYLYAEAGLTTITVFLSYLLYRSIAQRLRYRDLMVIAFLFGLAFLYKHFIGINFAAMIFSLMVHERPPLRKVFFLGILFCLPFAIYSSFMIVGGKDTGMVTVVTKSAEEWHTNRFAVRLHARPVTAQPNKLRNTWESFGRLWGSQSYPVWRLYDHKYSKSIPISLTVFLLSFFHLMILLLGGTALYFSKRDAFHAYTVASLVGLTLLSLHFFMAPRYHLPSMFLLILYAASLISKGKTIWVEARQSSGTRLVVWMVLIAVIVVNAIETWP